MKNTILFNVKTVVTAKFHVFSNMQYIGHFIFLSVCFFSSSTLYVKKKLKKIYQNTGFWTLVKFACLSIFKYKSNTYRCILKKQYNYMHTRKIVIRLNYNVKKTLKFFWISPSCQWMNKGFRKLTNCIQILSI